MSIQRPPVRRPMARPLTPPGRRRPGGLWIVLLAIVVVLALAGVSVMLARAPAGSVEPTATVAPTASAPSPSRAPSARSPAPTPTAAATPTATATPGPTSTPTPAATVTLTPGPNGAPAAPEDFDLHAQVIEIGFPLRPDTVYRYRDNFLDRREGDPDPFNHARITESGRAVRLHDGTDIYARQGEPVLAPFDGEVIDPSTRWRPWESGRYGETVAIISSEAASRGYAAVLVHLDRSWVNFGQRVTRGQVIGRLGRTGNAEGVQAQLHFELRAPFLLDWSELGEERRVDAFNPFPSLFRADPHPPR